MSTVWTEEQEKLLLHINECRALPIKPSVIDIRKSKVPYIQYLPSPIALHDMCVPCSLAIVNDKPLVEIFHTLCEYMADSGWMWNRLKCFQPYLESQGYMQLVRDNALKSLSGKTAHGLVAFFQHKEPTMLVVTRNHMYPIIKGTVVDSWDSRNARALYVYMHKDELARILA